eukprot:m.162184 g.162184  ORF g.162184 m.162184 type:complete len:325 (-) comp12155_c0_seq1:374-1348(-)
MDYAPMSEGYLSPGPPLVQVWFGDPSERELQPSDMYLAVYAAGGGKRNMANFVRQVPSSDFRTSDVHVFLSSDGAEINVQNSRFFICRWASARGEWVPKEIPSWDGEPQMKLVPEWFKARFWDNKQEKKHPWFMFALLTETDGVTQLFTSNSFPVHQYYPTGVKKTDPNDAACRDAFHKVLKTAPPTSLRPEHLVKKAGSVFSDASSKRRPSGASSYGMAPTPSVAGGSPMSSGNEFWASDDTASEGESHALEMENRKRKLAWSTAAVPSHHHVHPTPSYGYDRIQRIKMDQQMAMPPVVPADVPMEQVGAAEALLSLRWEPMR